MGAGVRADAERDDSYGGAQAIAQARTRWDHAQSVFHRIDGAKVRSLRPQP